MYTLSELTDGITVQRISEAPAHLRRRSSSVDSDISTLDNRLRLAWRMSPIRGPFLKNTMVRRCCL